MSRVKGSPKTEPFSKLPADWRATRKGTEAFPVKTPRNKKGE